MSAFLLSQRGSAALASLRFAIVQALFKLGKKHPNLNFEPLTSTETKEKRIQNGKNPRLLQSVPLFSTGKSAHSALNGCADCTTSLGNRICSDLRCHDPRKLNPRGDLQLVSAIRLPRESVRSDYFLKIGCNFLAVAIEPFAGGCNALCDKKNDQTCLWLQKSLRFRLIQEISSDCGHDAVVHSVADLLSKLEEAESPTKSNMFSPLSKVWSTSCLRSTDQAESLEHLLLIIAQLTYTCKP